LSWQSTWGRVQAGEAEEKSSAFLFFGVPLFAGRFSLLIIAGELVT
jgi:hypothetical protein